MKSKKIKILIVLMVGMFSVISCDQTFEEINTDPNAFNVVSPENQLAGVVKNTLDLIGGEMNFQMYLSYGLYMGGVGGQFPRYYWTESRLNGWWNDFYVSILMNIEEIINTYGDGFNSIPILRNFHVGYNHPGGNWFIGDWLLSVTATCGYKHR